jgi:hypothetical protein
MRGANRLRDAYSAVVCATNPREREIEREIDGGGEMRAS